MAKPRTTTSVSCDVCGKQIGRKADLARHMKTHAANKEELMYSCPYAGCQYKALQRSNLVTHINVHTGQRPKKCPTEGCDFSCGDPGSLTRHREEIHGYEPKANSRTSSTRREARLRRRVSPYTSSSSTSSSSASPTPPSDTSFDICHTPLPYLPECLDVSPPSTVLPYDLSSKEGNRISAAAFGTHLLTRLPQVNDLHLALNVEPEYLPVVHGLSFAPEIPFNHPQLPEPEQGNLYSVDMPAQPVSEMSFDNWFAQFNDPHSIPVSTPPSVSSSTVHVASHPSHVDGYDHIVGGSLPQYVDPYSCAASLPSYVDGCDYTVDNAAYGPHGHFFEAMPFDAQLSQLCSLAAPDMAICPPVIDQTYSYTALAGGGFPMQRLCVF